jgi:hypothetical protein
MFMLYISIVFYGIDVSVSPTVLPVQGGRPLIVTFSPGVPDVIIDFIYANGTFGNNTLFTPSK